MSNNKKELQNLCAIHPRSKDLGFLTYIHSNAIDPNQIDDYAIFYKGKWISLENKEHSERFEALRETAVYYPDIYKYKYRGDLKFLFTTYTYPDLDKDTLVSEQCLRRGVAGYYEAKEQTIYFVPGYRTYEEQDLHTYVPGPKILTFKCDRIIDGYLAVKMIKEDWIENSQDVF